LRCSAKNERRVLFLGDSVAFGWGVAVEECFVWRLPPCAARLGGDKRLTVINCSISGYSPWQEYDLLQSEGLRYQPDLVVLVFCLNDVVEKFQLRQFGGSDRGKAPPGAAALEWSGLFRTFRSWSTGMGGSADVDEARRRETYSVRRLTQEPDAPEIRRAWRITLENLGKIVTLAREHRVPLAIVCFPYPEQLLPEASQAPPPQRQIAAFAHQADVPFLDLLPVFRAYCLENGLAGPELFLDHNHPTPQGHQLTTESIHAFLASNGWL